MHILWLKTELLHPVDKGGRIRTYEMLRALRRDHRVTYLALDNGRAAPDAVERAVEYCHELIRVPFSEPERNGPAFWLDLAGNLGSSLPYAISKYRSPRMRSAIARSVAGGDVDVVVCDFLMPAQNVPAELPCRTVLFQHNVEAVIWRRHFDVRSNPLARAYFRLQWRRMEKFEREQCRRFDQVIAVSDADAEVFRSAYGVENAVSVPTGVDIEYFGETVPRVEPGHLVFVGAMDWMPNIDGVNWFASEVLPRIKSQVPGARLSIVGRNPGPSVRRLAGTDSSIEVTGSVPDVRPFLGRAAAVVVPLRIGGGTRLKIYEAMAAGRPVVATSVGAEGLPIQAGQHYLSADGPEELADACVRLLRDSSSAEALANRGADYVRERFSWARVAREFARVCLDAPAEARLHALARG